MAVTAIRNVDDVPVSAQFQDVPVDEGLRRLLTQYDTFFFYQAGESDAPMLAAIWIYRKGQSQGLMPVPPEEWAGTRELEAMRADPDPDTTARAAQTLIEREPARAADILAESLTDPDDRVWTRSLYSALSKGVRPASESLTDLALNGASPDVRFLALSTRAGARELAKRILSDDPDAHVRSRAEEILKTLSGTERNPKRPLISGHE